MKGRDIPYSEKERQWVSDNRTLPISELHHGFCHKFNRQDVSAVNLAAMRKRNGWLTGRSGCFKKGNVPHNAGSAGTGLMKPNEASFKKGNRPHNWRPVGSTRLSKDGYIEVKTKEPKTWSQLHTLIWAEANGEVPDGHCVSFKDGNKGNVELNNLELITRNENLQINRLGSFDTHSELTPTIRQLGKIIAKTIELKPKN